MSTQFQPIAILHGGRSKKTFKFFWDPQSLKIYIEKRGFLGSSKVATSIKASSRHMAFNACESYVHDK